MKTQFTLPRDQEEMRVYASGMAFYLAYMEQVQPLPGTSQDLRKRAEGAYEVLERTAKRQGIQVSNHEDQARKIIIETFTWGYQKCRSILKHKNTFWEHVFKEIQPMISNEAIDRIFKELWDQWESISDDLPREQIVVIQGLNEKPSCAYAGCQQHALQLVRTVTIGSQDGAPYEFHLMACEEHYEVINSVSRDNAAIQKLLERLLPREYVNKKALAAKKEKLLIDRFRIVQRWDEQDDEYKLVRSSFGEKGVQFSLAFVDAYVDIAKKYELAPSACAFVMQLPIIPFDRAIVEAIDFEERVFISFQKSVETPYGVCSGFSFGIKSLENMKYAQRLVPLSKSMFENMKTMMLSEENITIGLDAFTDTGLAIWTLSFELKRDYDRNKIKPFMFMTQSWQRCESGECGNGKPICDACMKINTWYYSLYANILRLIQGDYAVEDTMPIYTEKTMISKRKQPDLEKYWKMRDVDVSHTYRIVTMDALLRKEKSSAVHSETIAHGSWVDRLDPEQIIYVRKRISLKQGRTLKHPRYHKYILAHGGDLEEGYTISVKDHEKRIPMKLETLTRLIERVEAKGSITTKE